VRLLTEAVIQRKLVPWVGRETIRVLLESHDLKPWRKKMWCVGKLDEEYIARMEELLGLYEKPWCERAPVVRLDENPVVLHADIRSPQAMQPGRAARRDYEYRRCGTANVFCGIEPKAGGHLTKGDSDSLLGRVCWLHAGYRGRPSRADTIHLVMDNLSIHTRKALVERF
jgi:hypothetical protein